MGGLALLSLLVVFAATVEVVGGGLRGITPM